MNVYGNDTPWSGLGGSVGGITDVDELLTKTGLDWIVREEKCYIDIAGEKVDVGKKAIVRNTDDKVLSVSGENWNPVQNREALSFFLDYANDGGAKLEAAGSMRGGKIIWGMVDVGAEFTLPGDDKVGGRMIMFSSHEVGRSTKLISTSVRYICANLLNSNLSGTEFFQSHRRVFDINAARRSVEQIRENFAIVEQEAKKLSDLRISEYETMKLFSHHLQPVSKNVMPAEEENYVNGLVNDPTSRNSKMEAVLWANEKAPGAIPGNGWGTLNAVTYWADHMAGRNADARMFRSWLGHTNLIKQRVKTELLEMAS